MWPMANELERLSSALTFKEVSEADVAHVFDSMQKRGRTAVEACAERGISFSQFMLFLRGEEHLERLYNQLIDDCISGRAAIIDRASKKAADYIETVLDWPDGGDIDVDMGRAKVKLMAAEKALRAAGVYKDESNVLTTQVIVPNLERMTGEATGSR